MTMHLVAFEAAADFKAIQARHHDIEQVLLRKDVTGVRRLATSLMPSFAEALTPADTANLLAWLRGNLNVPASTGSAK